LLTDLLPSLEKTKRAVANENTKSLQQP